MGRKVGGTMMLRWEGIGEESGKDYDAKVGGYRGGKWEGL